MAKEILSKKQAIKLVCLYTFGDALLVMTGLDAKKDTWLAILIGMSLSIILMYIYGNILSSYRGKDLYEISEVLFGKIGGKVVCIIYIWYSLHLGALVLRTLIEFINTVGLEETPKIIPGICFMILCAWAAREGIEVIGRFSEFFLIWLVIEIILLLFLSISVVDITKLQPMFYDGIKPVLKGAISSFSFPFGESVIFLFVFDSLNKKDSSVKILITGTVLAGIYISYIAARNISAIGINAVLAEYFPTYSVVSTMSIGNFIQRLEIAVSLAFLIGILIKISLCIIAASKGVAKLFNTEDYRFIVVPVSILIINLSSFVYENIIELNAAPGKTWPYYSLPFQVIIPFIIFIFIKFRKKSDNIPE